MGGKDWSFVEYLVVIEEKLRSRKNRKRDLFERHVNLLRYFRLKQY